MRLDNFFFVHFRLNLNVQASRFAEVYNMYIESLNEKLESMICTNTT